MRDHLGSHLPWADLAPGEIRYYASFHPTFNPDASVELRLRGEAAELEVRTTVARYRPWWEPRSREVVERPVSPTSLAPWRADLAGVDPFALADEPDVTARDGMTVLGEARDGARYARFTAWGLERDTPIFRYFDAMRRVALRVVGDPVVAANLWEIGGYLRDGREILEDLGGSPRWLRLLPWPDERSARSLGPRLAALDPTEPWLLDLRGLPPYNALPPALLAVLPRLAARPGPLTLWLPPHLRRDPALAPLLARPGVELL